MKAIWYHIVKVFISSGLYFYFKNIEVVGKENIPKKGAILFVANHKNALIDPLLIATTTTRNIHFLTRASAFKIPLVKWILSTVNMLPIYRMRDGKATLAKNEEIFDYCFNLFNKGRSLLIFPEGTHDIRRWVRPLSKGFTRITFGALEQNQDLKLTIIPVGLNYSKAEDFAEKVSIYYGKPILANTYFKKDNPIISAQNLKEEVRNKMKELTTHIEDIENHDLIIKKLGTIDYLKPSLVNKKIANLNDYENTNFNSKSVRYVWKYIRKIVIANSFFPWLIWKAIKPKIKEIEFVSTTRFAIGVTTVPFFYILQSLALNYFFGIKIAVIYLAISFLLFLFLVKNK